MIHPGKRASLLAWEPKRAVVELMLERWERVARGFEHEGKVLDSTVVTSLAVLKSVVSDGFVVCDELKLDEVWKRAYWVAVNEQTVSKYERKLESVVRERETRERASERRVVNNVSVKEGRKRFNLLNPAFWS